MIKEKEQINKVGCPACGSTNIVFDREKQGEVKGKKGTAVVRKTVGVCKDCGYTWITENGKGNKKKTWLWVLGWIFIFPLPLTILLLRPSNKLNKTLKYILIAIAWIIYAILAWPKNDSDKTAETNATNSNVEKVVSTENGPVDSVPSEEKHLYDNAEVRDVMNDARDTKQGEYALIWADSNACTEEAITDMYYNYVDKNDFLWVAIIYSDKSDNSGVSFLGSMIGVNDIFEENEYGDYFVKTPNGESIYIPSGDGKTLKKIEYGNKEDGAEEITGLNKENTDSEIIQEDDKEQNAELFLEYSKILLDSSFGEGYYDVSREGSFLTVNVWGENIALAALFAANGDAKSLQSWNTLKESMESLSTTIYDSFKEVSGYEDATVMVNVINDSNKDNTLLSCVNGVCIYDSVESQ